MPDYSSAVLAGIAVGERYPVEGAGALVAVPLPGLADLLGPEAGEGPPVLRMSARNNLSVTFGSRLILKTFGRVEPGVNPDLELGRFLSAQGAVHIAPVLGYVEFRRTGSEPATLAVVHKFVENQGNAWQYTLDQLSRYFERVAAMSKENPPAPPAAAAVGTAEAVEPAPEFEDLAGDYLAVARSLGRITADLHRGLAAATDDPAVAPEPNTRQYQRSVYQGMRNLTGRVCGRVLRATYHLPPSVRDVAAEVVESHDAILAKFRGVLDQSLEGLRIRIHGDYHLAQLLFTGRDFAVIDFEGDPTKTVGERRIKRSPLRDVASMVRSFEYAVNAVLDWPGTGPGRPPGVIRAEDRPALAPWAAAWNNRVAHAFVGEYFQSLGDTALLASQPEARRARLDLFLLERAMHEVEFEVARRSEWSVIPLRAVLRLVKG